MFYFIIFFDCPKKTKQKKRHLQQGIFYSVYDGKKPFPKLRVPNPDSYREGLNLGAFENIFCAEGKQAP